MGGGVGGCWCLQRSLQTLSRPPNSKCLRAAAEQSCFHGDLQHPTIHHQSSGEPRLWSLKQRRRSGRSGRIPRISPSDRLEFSLREPVWWRKNLTSWPQPDHPRWSLRGKHPINNQPKVGPTPCSTTVDHYGLYCSSNEKADGRKLVN